ncbi:HAEPLYID family protein [Carboxylicivirga sp. N1Y90]|uniref:HAEPLYID family protein n=1 Tax=Carboxylicivirga fragile TaxID=3417571 RepID=UPI003D34848A|nr:phosphoribosylformylglycinamidine synthase [Marinilabiliaceae bacterium N1Y90]
MKIICLSFLLASFVSLNAQDTIKVDHAEPLYIDLIRDLGAHQGEKEWNVGFGLSDKLDFDEYEALVEYEFAPINRLGIEFELPFLFYSPMNGVPSDSVPSNRIESLKMGLQWSFYVSGAKRMSMALAYINELEVGEFENFGNPLFTGNVYNPIFIIAKRWWQNWHTLIYTGPVFEQHFKSGDWHSQFDMHTSIHYTIPETDNFVGVEFNKFFESDGFNMVIRPQMRLGIFEGLMLGIVTGIPINRDSDRFSTFLRLIWEPEH